MKRNINIGYRKIGVDYPTYVIAEMSANHGGDICKAKEIIYKAKESGADCIKIQTYTADTITIPCNKKYFRIKDGNWKGEVLYDLYKKAYTPWEWQQELKEEAEKIGLDFLSTPFDNTSVDFLEDINIKFYKIASFELIDIPLIKYVASKGKPIIMSTGMATLGEIEEAIQAVRNEGNEDLILLKCSSSYPAITDNMNLKTIAHMNKTFGVTTGLSDHSLGHMGAVIAVAMGAKVIEKHFCLDRKFKTPDSAFSMEPSEFKEMVKAIRETEKAMGNIAYGHNVKDENVSYSHRKSIFIVKDIKQGEMFTEENIKVKRPGHGIEPKYYFDILGKRALENIEFGEPLAWKMVGDKN